MKSLGEANLVKTAPQTIPDATEAWRSWVEKVNSVLSTQNSTNIADLKKLSMSSFVPAGNHAEEVHSEPQKSDNISFCPEKDKMASRSAFMGELKITGASEFEQSDGKVSILTSGASEQNSVSKIPITDQIKPEASVSHDAMIIDSVEKPYIMGNGYFLPDSFIKTLEEPYKSLFMSVI